MAIAGDVKLVRTRNPLGALKLFGFSIVSMPIAFVLWKLGGQMARIESDSLVQGVKHPVGLTTLAFYGVSLLMAGLGVLCFFATFWLLGVGVQTSFCPSCHAELDVRERPSTVRCAACNDEYRLVLDEPS